MAKSVANLSVLLTANTTKFGESMGKASRHVKSFGSRVQTASSRLKGMFTIVAGGGLLLLANNSLKANDSLAKTADAIGVTTEALAGLQHAAEITGVSAEAMQKSIGRMVVNIGDAAKGIGEARREFAALGLNVSQLARLAPDEQFARIAEALNSVTDETARTTAAYKIFGRQGIALKNTLALGADGIAAMTDEAERLGLAISRQDARRIESINDAFTRMRAAVLGAMTAFLVQLQPAIVATTNAITTLAVVVRGGLGSAMFKTIAAIAAFVGITAITIRVVGFLVNTFKMLVSAYKAVTTAQIIQKAFSGPAGWAALAVGVGVATGALIALGAAYKDVNAEMAKANEGIAGVVKQTNMATSAIEGMDAALGSKGRGSFIQASFARLATYAEPTVQNTMANSNSMMGRIPGVGLAGTGAPVVAAIQEQTAALIRDREDRARYREREVYGLN